MKLKKAIDASAKYVPFVVLLIIYIISLYRGLTTITDGVERDILILTYVLLLSVAIGSIGKASWRSFLVSLKERGLAGTKLFIGDRCLGLLEAIGEVFPEAKYQRCVVHFYQNVFSVVPRGKMKQVAAMLKAIHAQEDKEAAREKASAVVAKLREMKLHEAALKVENGIEETLTYMDFPATHWVKLRTTNVLERLNREIRRRTRVVGTFPDGHSALMLVCARLRHVVGTVWGTKRYMCMKALEEMAADVISSAG